MADYTGELAALVTAICWGFTSIFFSSAGKLVGSQVVNRTRLVLAVVMVSLFHWATEGTLFPIEAEAYRWGWLAVSSLIGFVIGDALLFQAFVMIGPRLSMLLMALAPVFSVILGWVLLNEQLSPQELLGIGLAVAGVAWVITDSPNAQTDAPQAKHYRNGILFGLGGAIGQAVGLIASKRGLDGDFPALSGNLIRLVVATAAIWLMALAAGQVKSNFVSLREKPRAMLGITFGAIAGPFIGVWMSLIAVQQAPVGIASTLMALTPVLLLPVSYYYFQERIGLRAIVGTGLAVLGTAVIFLTA
jgi:drug/metabolite transporter (DMT)-like permease